MNAKAKGSSGFLAAGGIAAVLASSCCLGPLVLVTLGFSGAWIGSLSALEPYRPVFLGFAVLTLLMAAFRIFRRPQECEADGICFTPKSRSVQKIIFSVVALLAPRRLHVPLFCSFPLLAFWKVFS
jgi:mercuric ion transport protein